MKNSLMIVGLLFVTTSALAEGSFQPCPEMDDAATAVAKINGATFASPKYRIMEVPVNSERGQEYSYQFNAEYSQGDEASTKIVGTIKVTALRKKGEEACKVLTLEYSE